MAWRDLWGVNFMRDERGFPTIVENREEDEKASWIRVLRPD
jgi:hypothetical protein